MFSSLVHTGCFSKSRKAPQTAHWPSSASLSIFLRVPHSPDEPGGGDKPSDEKRKEQTTPVVSPSQGSPEAKEER